MIANFRSGLIKELISHNYDVVVIAPEDNHTDDLIRLGCRVKKIKMRRNSVKPHHEFLLILQLFMQFMWERPDFICSYTIKNNIYSGLIAKILQIPFAANVTGIGPALNKKYLFRYLLAPLYKFTLMNAKQVFFQNPSDLDFFIQNILSENTPTQLLTGSGVDLKKFQYQPKIPSNTKTVFLLPARLIEEKGIYLFATVASQIQKTRPHVKFQIMGKVDTDSISAIPKSQIKTWTNEKIFEYLGELKDVRPAMHEADCIVLPTWYREGAPRVLLEAAAVGRPSITTDIPGCRDIVVDNETGILCRAKSSSSLTHAIEKFLQLTAQQRIAMGAEARSRAEQLFSEQKIVDSYMKIIRDNTSNKKVRI